MNLRSEAVEKITMTSDQRFDSQVDDEMALEDELEQ